MRVVEDRLVIDQKSSSDLPGSALRSIKNRSNIGPKSAQNRSKLGSGTDFASEAVFGPISFPFWLQLGGVLALMLGPCWPRNPCLEEPEGMQKRP